MDYIEYNSKLKNLWEGSKYKTSQGTVFSLYHISPSCSTLVSEYDWDNIYKSIQITIDTNELLRLISEGELQWIGSSLYDPWIRESDKMIIKGKEYYVDDVIGMSHSLSAFADDGHYYFEFHELDVIINNCPQLMKKSLLYEKGIYEEDK